MGHSAQLPELRKWLDDFPQGNGPDLWGRKVFRNLPKVTRYISYYLRHSFQEDKPFLMTVHISWIIEGPQHIIFGKEPLKPPPGYEDHDMGSLEQRSADERIKLWNAQQAAQPNVPAPAASKPPPVLSEPQSAAGNWWKWGLIILVLAYLGGRIWKRWANELH